MTLCHDVSSLVKNLQDNIFATFLGSMVEQGASKPVVCQTTAFVRWVHGEILAAMKQLGTYTYKYESDSIRALM
jgi:hypothetical protein